MDEHVGRGPMGIIAPTWYFAPQRPQVAEMGWQTAAGFAGLLGDGPIAGLDNPPNAVMLLQIAGEFANEEQKARLWAAAEEHIEPNWDRDRGEFTLGFKLGETHPRGQWNARSMAGWVAGPGDWSRIFNAPNLAKFDEPTLEGVDFPHVALSEARWDGQTMHVAAHPQNAATEGAQTTVRLTNITSTDGWHMTTADGESIPLTSVDDHVEVPLIADNRAVTLRRS